MNFRDSIINEFALAKNSDELWHLLHEKLERYHIGSVFYGITHSVYAHVAHKLISDIKMRYFKTSFDLSIWENKHQNFSINEDLGVLHCIEHIEPRISSKDSVWLSDDDRRLRTELESNTYIEKRWFKEDKRIGVTIPIRFGLYGLGGMGLQTKNITSKEFDEVWRWGREEIVVIVETFDNLARNKYDIFKTKLSSRERDIIFWLSEGCSAKVIADKLGKKTCSIQNRLAMMRKKLQVRNNVELISKVFVMELM